MTQDTFDAMLACLADPRDLRVWSVIMSAFGDLAQGPQDRLSGTSLGRLLDPLGLKPDAIRVALHRLRKEGWIESTRQGRVSLHQLSDFGREQSAEVTPRIYDRTPPLPDRWSLLLAGTPSGQTRLDQLSDQPGVLRLGRQAALCPGPVPEGDALLRQEMHPAHIPDWLKQQVCPPALAALAAQLLQDVRTAQDLCPGPDRLCPNQIATLRTVIVHRWRRVALRAPLLPDGYFPQGWSGQTCRTQVLELLDHLPRPGLMELDATA